MNQFEYKILHNPPESNFAKLGKDGWVLAAIIPMPSHVYGYRYVFIKRISLLSRLIYWFNFEKIKNFIKALPIVGGEGKRCRLKVGCIGSGDLKKNTLYYLDDNHNFIKKK